MKKVYMLFLLGVFFLSSSRLWYFDFNFEEFEKQKALWEAQKITSYTYEYLSMEFSYEHLLVSVQDGNYLSSKPLSGSNGLESGRVEYTETISSIYESLSKEAYFMKKKGWKWSYRRGFSCRGIDIEYDDVFHIPIAVYYDYHIPRDLHIDGNFNFQILNFKLMP